MTFGGYTVREPTCPTNSSTYSPKTKVPRRTRHPLTVGTPIHVCGDICNHVELLLKSPRRTVHAPSYHWGRMGFPSVPVHQTQSVTLHLFSMSTRKVHLRNSPWLTKWYKTRRQRHYSQWQLHDEESWIHVPTDDSRLTKGVRWIYRTT